MKPKMISSWLARNFRNDVPQHHRPRAAREVAALVLMPLVVQLGEEAGVERIAVLLGVGSSSVRRVWEFGERAPSNV